DWVASLGESFESQVRSFIRENPFGRGVHWASGQEIVFRQMAWLFAVGVFESLGRRMESLRVEIVSHIHQSAQHLESNLDYARRSVYNNHLLSEALGLYLSSRLL